MPAHFNGRFILDGFDKAARARMAENFGRTHYFIQGMLLSGRRAELIPYFQAFFDFCRGRSFTPEAKLFADYILNTARFLNIRDARG